MPKFYPGDEVEVACAVPFEAVPARGLEALTITEGTRGRVQSTRGNMRVMVTLRAIGETLTFLTGELRHVVLPDPQVQPDIKKLQRQQRALQQQIESLMRK